MPEQKLTFKSASTGSSIVDKELDRAEKIAKVDPKQLEIGRKVEMEHTSDPDEAEKIALDHLLEPGHEDYYTKLKAAGLA